MDTTPSAAVVPIIELTSEPAPVPEDRVRALSGRPRRTFAWGIDYLIVMVPGLALIGFVVATMLQSLPAFLGAVAAEAGWSRVVHLFTSNGALGLSDAAAREWLVFALPLIVALLVVPFLQFLYQGVMLAWRGRTFGMMIADIRIESTATRERVRFGPAVTRAALRTLIETGLVGVALVLMLFGLFRVGALLWGAAVILFWLDVLAVLGRSRRTLIDRLAGTAVVRTSAYATAARGIAAGAATVGRHGAALMAAATRAATEVTTAAGRGALATGRAISDAAAVTGDLARQGADALTRSTAVRQALDSEAAAQAQAIAASGAERARQLGGEAAERVRDLGGRAADSAQRLGEQTRRLWRERRTDQ